MKKILLVAVALLGFVYGASAQTLGFSANEELMTKYVWRGMMPGNFSGPFTPGGATDVGLNFTSADENFYMETYLWTYQSMNAAMHYSEYQYTLYTEYYGAHLEFNHYFGDMGEIGVGYTLPGAVPASITFYTSLYGDDYDETETKRNFSNYIELLVPYNTGNWDFQLTVGSYAGLVEHVLVIEQNPDIRTEGQLIKLSVHCYLIGNSAVLRNCRSEP